MSNDMIHAITNDDAELLRHHMAKNGLKMRDIGVYLERVIKTNTRFLEWIEELRMEYHFDDINRMKDVLD